MNQPVRTLLTLCGVVVGLTLMVAVAVYAAAWTVIKVAL